MKVTVRLLLASAAANAINIPVPVEGATLNLNVQLQPWMQIQEDFPAPNVGEQFFFRRVRLLAQGQFSPELLFLIQLDSPNFGKNGDFNAINNRELIQDAWVAWHPTENLFLDFGMLLLPIARHTLQSTTSYTNMDFHVDSINPRDPNTNGFRDMGVSLRGWALDKKIGFRFGAYTGNRSTSFGAGGTAANPAIDRQGVPKVAGFINFNLLDSEEGAWLYQGLYFGDKKVLSIGFGGEYQPGGVAAAYGVTDHKMASADIYFDYPMGDSEVIISATGYRFFNGNGAANTGYAGFIDLGYRFGKWQPYVSYEFFNGDGCPTDATTGANLLPCTANTNDLREPSVGINYWIKRNTLHINTELTSIRNGNFTLGQAQGVGLPTTGGPQKHQTRFTLGATMFY